MALNLSIQTGGAASVRTPLLVLFHFQDDDDPAGPAADVDGALNGLLARVLNRGDFRGRAGQAMVVYPEDPGFPAERVAVVGLGPREEASNEAWRRAVGTAVRRAEELGVDELTLAPTADDPERLAEVTRAAVEGAVLASWDYRDLKAEPGPDDEPVVRLRSVAVLTAEEDEADRLRAAVDVGRIIAEAENLARELASKPGNVATPSHLADVARGIAEEGGMELTVFDRATMEAEGFGGILGVAAGSEEEPRLVILEYQGADEGDRPLALIGKGVTFDAGGISIKPSKGMEKMKADMAGAAAVLGCMQAVARLRPRINVVALVPATENLLSGRATKPGDVLTMYSGKTVEVINTDAEGRLILADALAYAARYEPRATVDVATLTGSVLLALGYHAAGLMGSDQELVDAIRDAGERTGERCWQLPLWDDYRGQLDSEVADLKNTGGRPAGTITAGWFLREFAGDGPWAHLDIAAVGYREEPTPYLRKGATGIPTRLFIEWIRSQAEQ